VKTHLPLLGKNDEDKPTSWKKTQVLESQLDVEDALKRILQNGHERTQPKKLLLLHLDAPE
jgi:hypothetical protein